MGAYLHYRDPNTGQMVPVLGSMTQAEADARYLKKTGGTITGPLIVTGGSNSSIAPKSYADARKIPAGMTVWWPSNAIPTGWLLANGALLKRADYPDLFAAIGTTYGFGDGVTTFAAPNLVGRLAVGRDSANADYSTIGALIGDKDVTLALSQVPGASGSFTMHNAGNSTMLYHSGGSWTEHNSTVDYRTGYENPNNPSVGRANMNLGFGGGAHSNTMPYIILNAIVKT